MSTIKEYLKYYKDTSFDDYKFNEIDNILFSEFSYINWDNIVPKNSSKIRLDYAIKIYLSNLNETYKKSLSSFMKSNIENLKIIQNSARYKNCFLSNYINEVNDKTQFGALCIHFNNNEVYISFKGTDSTLIGWKEDLALSYQFPTYAQKHSIEYLNNVITRHDNIIYIGGHSKGGNLAMTAYMYASTKIKNKVKKVFNNDGPGFKSKEYNSPFYKEMISKLIMIIPENSIVGILLNNSNTFKVVKSSFNGPYEHDCNSWECFGSFLIEGKLSTISIKLKERIDKVLNTYDDIKKEEIINTFFEILQKAEIKNFSNLSSIEWNQIVGIIKGFNGLDNTTRNLFLSIFKSFIEKTSNNKKR